MSTPVFKETSIKGHFGHQINPGDQVVTFTQNGRGSKVSLGTFQGITEATGKYRWDTDRVETMYLVKREDGKVSRMHYPTMVPNGTTIEELNGCTLS